MQSQTIFIPTMQGGRAAETVMRALNQLPHVRYTGVDPRGRTIRLQWEAPSTWEHIQAHLSATGFPPSRSPAVPDGQQPLPVYETRSRG